MAQDSNKIALNFISRNSPVALVIGAASPLGSHVVDDLLKKGIQVIGVDDLTVGDKKNLELAVKNKSFHFLNESIVNVSVKRLESLLINSVSRFDYAVFAPLSNHLSDLYSRGVINFLSLIKNYKEDRSEEGIVKLISPDKPKIVFISSISLYDNDLDTKDEYLKEGEVRFAKYVKYHKLNARIVRLSPLFGPRMTFLEDDPVIKLIQASISNELPSEHVSLDFSTRSLYIEDAANLVIKSILVGATAHKIYDGVLPTPVKVSEIKQILLDPLWHESRNFKPTELPPWPTPNLDKTLKELSWKPKVEMVEALKRTIAYLKDNEVSVPKLEKNEWRDDVKRWSFSNPDIEPEKEGDASLKGKVGKEGDELNLGIKKSYSKVKYNFIYIVVTGLIILGLILPFAQLAIGAFSIRAHLKSSADAISKGDFEKGKKEIRAAKSTISESKQIIEFLNILKRSGVLNAQIEGVEELVLIVDEGVEGAGHAVLGTEALFKTTKIISGEQNADPKPLYKSAQLELTTASQKIDRLKGKFENEEFLNKLPKVLRVRAEDLLVKIQTYSSLVDKARSAAYIMPEFTAVNGKKTYLVLNQNNLELRPTGGFIGSYGKLTFENGKISNILVDDIYNLDGGLKEIIEPPVELRTDLGQERLYLRDSNFDPDFPTSARVAQVFFKKEAGEGVDGVFALDLSASGKLLDAVSGLDLPDYGEHVNGSNLFERAITHAEVNFFPGSQAKKNYLTALQNQLFNKIFYLSNQNWPSIIKALSDSLEQKHLLIYLADSKLFSYIASENWSGVMPRGAEEIEGVSSDFLAVVESNMGANKSNYYLERKVKLETVLGKEGQVYHKLVINYKNSSPSEVFPAGKYKNRIRVYLPLGTKLTRVVFGETDITQDFSTFSDYGRTGFNGLVTINPKEQKSLIFEYNLNKLLSFKDKNNKYRLDIIKQAGTLADQFDWQLTYPINLKANQAIAGASSEAQELTISTDLQTDRSFAVDFTQK